MLDLDCRLLRTFVTAVEVGTVNGAAKALNRTQAAVSMQIQRLEEQLGTALFERTVKGLKLTAGGLMLLPNARNILRINDDVSQQISGLAIGGRVRLGVLEDFAASFLIDILKTFRDRHRQIQIDIIVDTNRNLAAMFEANQIDLAVCDVNVLDRPAQARWTDQLYWVVRDDIRIEPEAPLPIIMFDIACPWRERAVECLSGVAWSIVCEAGALPAVSAAIRVGVGIGMMTHPTIPSDCRVLRNVRNLPPSLPIELGLYVHRGKTAVNLLAGTLEEALTPPLATSSAPV
jgi:DNA-binding transcriptional LysR family regulator